MTPTPEQVAQWAREAGGSVMQPYDYGAKPDRMILTFEEIHRLVTRAMAEQAEADAALGQAQKDIGSSIASDAHNNAIDCYSAAIRANAPKA